MRLESNLYDWEWPTSAVSSHSNVHSLSENIDIMKQKRWHDADDNTLRSAGGNFCLISCNLGASRHEDFVEAVASPQGSITASVLRVGSDHLTWQMLQFDDGDGIAKAPVYWRRHSIFSDSFTRGHSHAEGDHSDQVRNILSQDQLSDQTACEHWLTRPVCLAEDEQQNCYQWHNLLLLPLILGQISVGEFSNNDHFVPNPGPSNSLNQLPWVCQVSPKSAIIAEILKN